MDYSLLIDSFEQEVVILSRVLYKVTNQQRRNYSFKHLQAVVKLSKKVQWTNGVEIAKIRNEIGKCGMSLLFNLRLNYFANYSSVVQAMLARMDAILNKMQK